MMSDTPQLNTNDMAYVLGYSIEYWDELEALHRKMREINAAKLIQEIAALRAKNSFYESRIKQMNDFMALNIEVR